MKIVLRYVAWLAFTLAVAGTIGLTIDVTVREWYWDSATPRVLLAGLLWLTWSSLK